MSARKRLKAISFYADRDAQRDYRRGALEHLNVEEVRSVVSMWAEQFAISHVYPRLSEEEIQRNYHNWYVASYATYKRESEVRE